MICGMVLKFHSQLVLISKFTRVFRSLFLSFDVLISSRSLLVHLEICNLVSTAELWCSVDVSLLVLFGM
jgi:hypothetical protein